MPSNSRMFSFPLATELSVLCGLHKRCFPQSARMFAYMQKKSGILSFILISEFKFDIHQLLFSLKISYLNGLLSLELVYWRR